MEILTSRKKDNKITPTNIIIRYIFTYLSKKTSQTMKTWIIHFLIYFDCRSHLQNEIINTATYYTALPYFNLSKQNNLNKPKYITKCVFYSVRMKKRQLRNIDYWRFPTHNLWVTCYAFIEITTDSLFRRVVI